MGANFGSHENGSFKIKCSWKGLQIKKGDPEVACRLKNRNKKN